MFKLLLVAAAVFLFWNSKGITALPMDSSAWEVQVRRKRLFALSHPDTLVFQDGRFISSQRLSSGFFPARYQMQRANEEGYKVWEASSESASQGTLHWVGQMQGDEIKGTATWVHKNGKIRIYSFQGRRKP